MLTKTGTNLNPWMEFKSDDKKEVRLAVMKFLLCRIEGFDKKELKPENKIITKHE